MRHFLSFLILFIVNVSAVAQNTSSEIFQFLEISTQARNSALGGGHVALFEGDFSQFHVNPAYLDSQAIGKASATYMNFLGEANLGAANTVLNLKKVGVIGLGIRFVSYGALAQLDENGNNLGTFHPGDIALSGAYSYKVSEKLQAGAALNLIYSSYAKYSSSALGLNGGLFYQDVENRFSAGFSVRNLGSQLTAFNGQREPLPLDISAGISKKPEAFPFHLHFTFRQLNNWDMRIYGESEKPNLLNNLFRHLLFGGESRFTENFHVRIGYDHLLHEKAKSGSNFDLAGLAFGVGFKIKEIQVDISRNSYSDLGGIIQLSIKTQVY